MARPHVPAWLRDQVRADAEDRCGYCLTPQSISNVRHEIEHIVSVARGGNTTRDNLWLSRATCNRFKADRISGVDPATGRRIRLFNPRRQRWRDHFSWEGILTRGITATGRATVETLQLNHVLHLSARRSWWLLELFAPQR